MENMNTSVSVIVESNKDTIVRHLGNSDKSYVLFQILYCWHVFAVDKDNWYLTIVLGCSDMMHKHYSRIDFFPIKHNTEGKYIHN